MSNNLNNHTSHNEKLSEEQTKKILEQYDSESRTRVFDGIRGKILKYSLAAFSIYTILLNFVFHFETRINRASFVGFLVFFSYLLYPAKKHMKNKNQLPIYDLILALLSGFCYFYFVFHCEEIINLGMRISPLHIVIGIIGLLTTLEACRRVTGIPIVIVASLFVIYGLTQKSLKLNIYNLFYTTEGIIGTPIKACQTFIVIFVIFGAFLEKTGISEFFIELANSIAGSSTGGPAKVAVISSSLCGMVSGSSVGNTVTTGAVTIPLMKKNGYKPEFAGAVEAAASTGGQIMPPIMGAAAFLMVEYTGELYNFIAIRAILPALLYFAGIFISVHLEAKKLGLKGLSKESLPVFSKVIKESWYLLLPLVTLTALLIKGMTMAYAALIAIFISILVSIINKKTEMNIEKFFDALESGAKSTISVGIACAVAGIIACIITTTGIGTILISAIVGISKGNLIIAMLLTMVTCIILGMGVPTTANYVIMATTCAPILIKMGMNPFAAHMFVFYFGIVADITPPVALAAYAGSAIAGSKPMVTAFNATQLAIAAFIVPFVFGLNPALLFINTNPLQVIVIVITSLIGIFGVSSGIRGYSIRENEPLQRFLLILGGLMLIYPGVFTDIAGILLIVGSLAIDKFAMNNENEIMK